PEQHRDVPVAEPGERRPRTSNGRHRSERSHGALVVADEVEPPQAGAEREPEQRDRAQCGVTGRCAAPIPIATTDSPIATSTTSPCRSTKCAAPIANPLGFRSTGVSHSKTNASVQSAYCAPPPSAPPATTSSAEATLDGVKRG